MKRTERHVEDDKPAGSIAAALARASAAIVLLLLVTTGSVAAQGVIRDAEIETMLRRIADPLLEAGHLVPASVDIYMIRDDRLNAFVAGGQNLFLHTGLLTRAEAPEQVAGVIAHETGHIAGGHLSRASAAADRAGRELLIGSLLGLAAAVAGAPQVGIAAFAGGATLAERGFLAFTRSQEQSADQAAIAYLATTGQSPEGLLGFFKVLESSNYRINRESSPFLRSHPLTRDRITFLEQQVASSPYAGRHLPADIQESFRRSRAKLEAFLGEPKAALASWNGTSIADRYARAIAHHRLAALDISLQEIDGLIADEPRNPYFHELKGQVLFENGKVAESVAPYRRSVELDPGSGLLRFGLARALLEADDRAGVEEAAALLRDVVGREPDNAAVWRFLGIAEGKLGHRGASAVALTEWAVLRRDAEDARLYLGRAEQAVATGDRNWLRLQDLRRAVQDLKDRDER